MLALGAGACGGRALDPAAPHAPLRFTPSDAALRVAERASTGTAILGGLYTFDEAPLERWDLAGPEGAALLDLVRGATVRFGAYCSGAFISPDGLLLTTQSCVRECIRATTVAGRDDLATGVYARRRADERRCPELRVDQLVGTFDVTDEIRAAVEGAGDAAAAASARAAVMARLEWSCGAERAVVCEVVELNGGARTHLYRYRRYNVVKLVFAPELQAARFGGSHDELAWPRYSLDFAFARVYESDGRRAARTPQFLRIRTDGPTGDEPLLLAGSAGSTYRYLTVAQLAYEREVRHPQMIRILEGLDRILTMASRDPELRRLVRDESFTVSTSLEGYRAQLTGLHDSLLVGSRLRWEKDLRERVRSDPALERRYGDVWGRIAALQPRKAAVAPRLNAANVSIVGAPHLLTATQLVRYLRETAKPVGERDPAYRGDSLERIEAALAAPSDIRPDLAREFLAVHLDLMARALSPGDPLRDVALEAEETPARAARRLTRTSRLLDPDFRVRVMRQGVSALDPAADPLLALAAVLDSAYDALQRQWSEIQREERRQRARLGEAMLAVYGAGLPSDGTGTPRISAGVLAGYPQAASMAPPFSTFHGLFDRAAAFGSRGGPPGAGDSFSASFALPPAFERRHQAVRLDTPIAFLVTADVAGSGAVVIDRQGRLAGIVHDTNLPHLRNRLGFVFADGRAIAVHGAGILESLRSVYRTQALLDELQRRQ